MNHKKKTLVITLLSIAIVIFTIFIGGKTYKEYAEISIERKGALKIKSLFKNIKVIKVTELFESSPGVKNVNFDVIDLEGNTIKDNSTTVGDFGGYSENGLIRGATDGKVKVIYTTGDEEVIE